MRERDKGSECERRIVHIYCNRTSTTTLYVENETQQLLSRLD